MKFFCSIIGIILLIGCSKSSSDLNISTINLTVDKDVGIIGQDTFYLTAEVLNDVYAPIEGLGLKYYADDVPLEGNRFIPEVEGRYVLSARYKDIRSKTQIVNAISLTENIEEFTIKYNGNRFLTTHDWSVTGPFTYVVRKQSKLYEFQSSEIPMFINKKSVSYQEAYHFNDAGTYFFTAVLDGKTSNEVKITVRDQINHPVVEIPVIFHSYNVPDNLLLLDYLIDTLNASFNDVNHTREQVMTGKVNPNAVDMGMRFKLAEEAPTGFTLARNGHHILDVPGNPEALDYNTFRRLQEDNTWDEETYINIWLTDAVDFDPPPGYVLITGMTTRPVLKSETLDGLITSSLDTLGITHGIILYPDQLKIHGDYIVRMVGTYYGLYSTIAFGCINEGDYCPDTPKYDFSKPDGPGNTKPECSGYYLTPSNHMSFNRKYTNFTFDQRERVRAVIRDGWRRPG